jgi:hypothetical protein
MAPNNAYRRICVLGLEIGEIDPRPPTILTIAFILKKDERNILETS